MDRLKVLVGAYRKWAVEASEYLTCDVVIAKTPEELVEKFTTEDPDIIFLIGWSWIVPADIHDKITTFCFHPSDLPAYRGGSPLQHQIIDGIKQTKATMFIVDNTLDHGDIVSKCDLSLEGNISDIQDRMKIISGMMMRDIVEKYPDIDVIEQDKLFAIRKRRTPEESEIHPTDFFKNTAEDLYNKIRALGDPYPNAFVKCQDGKKLYFKEVSIGT